jgi:hypothetical protein
MLWSILIKWKLHIFPLELDKSISPPLTEAKSFFFSIIFPSLCFDSEMRNVSSKSLGLERGVYFNQQSKTRTRKSVGRENLKSHAHKKKYCEGAEKTTRGGGKYFLLVACAFFSFTLVQSHRPPLKALTDAERASGRGC